MDSFVGDLGAALPDAQYLDALQVSYSVARDLPEDSFEATDPFDVVFENSTSAADDHPTAAREPPRFLPRAHGCGPCHEFYDVQNESLYGVERATFLSWRRACLVSIAGRLPYEEQLEATQAQHHRALMHEVVRWARSSPDLRCLRRLRKAAVRAETFSARSDLVVASAYAGLVGPQRDLADAYFDYNDDPDRYHTFTDIFISLLADGEGGDVILDSALSFFIRALSLGPSRGSKDVDLARLTCHLLFRHRRLLLCDALQVSPRVSPLQFTVTDLGQDVFSSAYNDLGDYNDALRAASAARDARRAADIALRDAYDRGITSTIGLLLADARSAAASCRGIST